MRWESSVDSARLENFESPNRSRFYFYNDLLEGLDTGLLENGQDLKFKVKKGFQVGAYMVVPPFPFDDKKSFEIFSKDSVVLFKAPNREGIHPIQVKNINSQWLITGNSGIVLLIVGTGMTMREAQKNMYNRIANIIINNSYYRNDIGNRWAEDSDKLLSWGLL